MFQTIFNVFVVVIGGLLVRRVRRLSAERAGVNAKLDTLSETVRDDFAAQWQQQFRSKALDKDHQSELETIISVQAERLAAQGKQISVLREKADTSVTQNDDIQTHQQELIESLQTQLDNLREKTEDMFRAQAAQFNHRFAFQQELRAEYDRLAKLVQAVCYASAMHGGNFPTIVNNILSNGPEIIITHPQVSPCVELVQMYSTIHTNK